jgi:hypothetical protein
LPPRRGTDVYSEILYLVVPKRVAAAYPGP